MTVPDSYPLEGAIPITDRWRSEWNKPLQVLSKNMDELSRPVEIVVDDEVDPLDCYERPRHMLFTQPMSELEFDHTVHYTLDTLDIQFHARLHKDIPEIGLTLDSLECIMDRLEKESFYALATNRYTVVTRPVEVVAPSNTQIDGHASIFAFLHHLEGKLEVEGHEAVPMNTHNDQKLHSRPVPNTRSIDPAITAAGLRLPLQAPTVEGLPVGYTCESDLRQSVSVPLVAARLGIADLCVGVVMEVGRCPVYGLLCSPQGYDDTCISEQLMSIFHR